MPTFPTAASPQEFEELGRDHPRVSAGAQRICDGLGLGQVELFRSGSVPVFAAGREHVLKLYPPCYAHEAEHERTLLEALRGALPLTVPRVAAAGELDGWRYLAMERVSGEPLADVWPRLGGADRIALAAQAGHVLAALHRVTRLHRPDSPGAWTRFLRGQKEACVEAHRTRGADPRWLEQIPAFLVRAEVPDVVTPVLLHTEIMREHLFVARTSTGWSLSGLIDFEPSMVGAAEYEFASVGIFLTCGDGPALRALLLAYGFAETDLGLPLQRRFLAYALLHRYANLRRFLERLPVPSTVRTLDDLARRWWSVGEEGD